MLTQFSGYDIRDGLYEGRFCVQKFSKNLFARGYEVNEKYRVCSLFFEQEYMAHVDSLLSKKRNGEILGKVFGVPFAISESLTNTDFSSDYLSLYNVTILRRLFAEGALLFCATGKNSDCLLHGSKPHSYEVNQDISEYCQVSLAVSYGLTPLGLAGNSNSEWIFQTLRAGVFTFVPSRSTVPYTGLSIEKCTNKRLVFFARNLKDMCLFCEVCSGDDGHDENLLRTLRKRLLVDQNFLNVFKPRVLFIREKLNNNFQESDSVWIADRITSDDFYIDNVELSEFLNLDELNALYNFENAELEDRSLANESSIGRKYDNSPFETLISDFLDTSDVIILEFDEPEVFENNFEYKLLKLFYFGGFPIVGVPLDFSGEKKIKPMLFFIGCKKRDDKLVSVVDYCLNIL